jgi:hypothetical protein
MLFSWKLAVKGKDLQLSKFLISVFYAENSFRYKHLINSASEIVEPSFSHIIFICWIIPISFNLQMHSKLPWLNSCMYLKQGELFILFHSEDFLQHDINHYHNLILAINVVLVNNNTHA